MNREGRIRRRFFLPLLKRQLKKPGLYLVALLCLFFLYVFGQLVFPSAALQDYGVYAGESANAERLLAALHQTEGAFHTVEYSDRKTLVEDVTSGKVDCGFVLTDRIDTVKDLDHMENLVDYICSTSTMKGLILREKVFAAVLQVVSGNLLEKMGEDGSVFKGDAEEITADLDKFYRYYLDGNYTLKVDLETVEVPETAAETAVRSWRLSGSLTDSRSFVLCGILIFTCALIFSRSRFSQESRTILCALRGGERIRWRFLEILLPVLLVTAALTAAFLLLQYTGGEAESLPAGQALRAVARLFLCGFVSAAWAALYSCIFRREETYLFTIPLVVILAVVTCPAVMDLGSMMPLAGAAGWLFPVSYL